MNLPERGSLRPPISCEGRWVKLRPLSRPDFLTLFRWRADIESLHLWSSERRVPSFEEYVEEMERFIPTTVTLLILTKAEEPIGFVQGYHLSHVNGWCRFLIYLTPEHRGKGYPVEALLLFADYGFANFNFRKVYADVFEYNEDVLRMLGAAGFVEEGRLKEHVFFQGRFWDMCHLALYREGWEELKQRLGFSLYAAQADDAGFPGDGRHDESGLRAATSQVGAQPEPPLT